MKTLLTHIITSKNIYYYESNTITRVRNVYEEANIEFRNFRNNTWTDTIRSHKPAKHRVERNKNTSILNTAT